jgi:hypothetical protein
MAAKGKCGRRPTLRPTARFPTSDHQRYEPPGRHRLPTGSRSLAIGTLIGQAAAAIGLLVAVRRFDPADFGDLGIFAALAIDTGTLGTLRFEAALPQSFLPKCIRRRRIPAISTARALRGISMGVILIYGTFQAPKLESLVLARIVGQRIEATALFLVHGQESSVPQCRRREITPSTSLEAS